LKSVVTTYFVLTGHRHCSELGRLVLNMCVPVELLTLEFERQFACSRAVNQALVSLGSGWGRENSRQISDLATVHRRRTQHRPVETPAIKQDFGIFILRSDDR